MFIWFMGGGFDMSGEALVVIGVPCGEVVVDRFGVDLVCGAIEVVFDGVGERGDRSGEVSRVELVLGEVSEGDRTGI